MRVRLSGALVFVSFVVLVIVSLNGYIHSAPRTVAIDFLAAPAAGSSSTSTSTTAQSSTTTTSTTIAPTTTSTTPPWSYDWDAIAECETGGEEGATPGSGHWTADGAKYSSGLGVLNEAVRDHSPPDVAARILAGAASKDEQVAMAESVARAHGIHSWACGRKLYP